MTDQIKHGKISVEIVKDVTPEQAQEWLAHNVHNRPLRDRALGAYARDMKDGHWVFNGDAIRFDTKGVLLDGQHRLTAQVQADVTLDHLVIRGVTPESQLTMDTGARRSFGDHLRLLGFPYAERLARFTRYMWLWQDGELRTESNQTATTSELVEVWNTLDPDSALEYARLGGRFSSRWPGLPSGLIVAFLAHVSGIDADDAEAFGEQIIGDIPVGLGDPAFLLRQRLLQAADGSGRVIGGQRMALGLMCRAWNAYREGKKVQRLNFRSGGANPDAFPKLV